MHLKILEHLALVKILLIFKVNFVNAKMQTRCKLSVTNKLNLVITKNCLKESNALDIMKNNPLACACNK